MMPGDIAVPAPEAFPRDVRGYVQRLRRALDAAVQRGDLLRARGIRLSLQVMAIWWPPGEARGRSVTPKHLLQRLKQRVLRGWVGQKVWYRYVFPPGAYCRACGRYYTYDKWDRLRTERVHPQYAAHYTICVCGTHEWRFVG